MMIIYKLTNKINNKIYIGQTIKPFKERLRGHLYDALYRKKPSDSRLSNAIRKYGIDNFNKEIIHIAETLEELNYLEEFYINKYNSRDRNIGYNIKYGGENCLHSNETKRKIGNDTKKRFKENKELREKVLNGLRKGTLTIIEKSKENFIEKKCEYCGEIMKLKPNITKKKKFCSDKCHSESKKGNNGLQKANEATKILLLHRQCTDRINTVKFAKEHIDLILNMPLNRINLNELIIKLGYKDIRPIATSFNLKGGKQLLIELKEIVKMYARQG